MNTLYAKKICDENGQHCKNVSDGLGGMENLPHSANTVCTTDGAYCYNIKLMPDGHYWTVENMRHPPRNLTNSWSNGTSYKTWWAYYNNDSSHKNEGMLYTWRASMGCTSSSCSSENLSNSVCGALGEGWHLPSDDEWKALEKSLGCADYDELGRRCDCLGWMAGGLSAKIGGLVSYLPGLRYRDDGDFYTRGSGGDRWSSTASGGNNARYRRLRDNNSKVYRYSRSKAAAFSVVCIKN